MEVQCTGVDDELGAESFEDSDPELFKGAHAIVDEAYEVLFAAEAAGAAFMAKVSLLGELIVKAKRKCPAERWADWSSGYMPFAEDLGLDFIVAVGAAAKVLSGKSKTT
jgi:hypothetical protein